MKKLSKSLLEDLNANKDLLGEFNELILNSTPNIIYIYDMDAEENVYCNDSISTVLGYSIEEVQEMGGAMIEILTYPDDFIDYNETVLPKYEGLKDGEWLHHEYRMKHKNGSWRWLRSKETSFSRDENGQTNQIYGIVSDVTEDKEIREQLQDALRKAKESEHRYNELFQNMNNGCAVYETVDEGEDFVFVDYNKAGERMDKTRKTDLIGKKVTEAFPGIKDFGLHDVLKRVYETGVAEHYPIKFYADDYLQGWRDNYVFRLNTGEVVSVYYDRTAEKVAEEALKLSQERFELVMNATRDGLFDWNLIDDSIYYSPSWKKMLGYEDNELPNDFSVWESLTEPEDVKKSMEMQKRLINSEIDRFEIEFKMKHKDGHWVDVLSRATAIFNDEGKAIRIVGTHIDISERKRIKAQLKMRTEDLDKAKETIEESQSRFRALINIIPDLIFLKDVNGVYLFCNKNFEELYGAEESEIVGKTDYDFVSKEMADFYRERDMIAFKSDKPIVNEEYVINAKGERLDLETIKLPVVDTEGKAYGVLGVARDITLRKQQEDELILAKEKAEESDRLKSEFLNNMSHEIRTPMNGIIGFSEELGDVSLSDEKRIYFSKIVQNSALQLLKIIDDILEISTLETKQIKPANETICLNDFLMELFSIFDLKAKEKNLRIYLYKQLIDEQSHISSDRTKLHKVLSNLIENALKYTNEGYIEIGYEISGEKLNVYVKDTGIGIADEKQKVIFNRFSQEQSELSKRAGGLGLGLSIAKENAQLMGGDISLDSVKGEGSTFILSIPFVPVDNLNEELSSKDFDSEEKMKPAILIAEDEEVNYLYIEVIFEHYAYNEFELIHAKNGREAVELCQKLDNIVLVLMDIKMPVMNGLEASKMIKKECPNLPIIAQTAYSTEVEKELALGAGCDGFISKPVNRKLLFELIEEKTGDFFGN